MAKSFLGRAFEKIKNIFIEPQKPKPAPKKLPTTRPTRPQKSEAVKRGQAELMKARDEEQRLMKNKRTKLVNKLEDLYGDRENRYGENVFNKAEVKTRVRRMPDSLVNQLSNLTTTDAIDLAYANSQTEFHGYDQPQGFWYH